MKRIIILSLIAVSMQAAPERTQVRIPFYLISPTPKKVEAPVFDPEVRRQLVAYLQSRAVIAAQLGDYFNGNDKAEFYFLGREEAFNQAAQIVADFKPEVKK